MANPKRNLTPHMAQVEEHQVLNGHFRRLWRAKYKVDTETPRSLYLYPKNKGRFPGLEKRSRSVEAGKARVPRVASVSTAPSVPRRPAPRYVRTPERGDLLESVEFAQPRSPFQPRTLFTNFTPSKVRKSRSYQPPVDGRLIRELSEPPASRPTLLQDLEDVADGGASTVAPSDYAEDFESVDLGLSRLEGVSSATSLPLGFSQSQPPSPFPLPPPPPAPDAPVDWVAEQRRRELQDGVFATFVADITREILAKNAHSDRLLIRSIVLAHVLRSQGRLDQRRMLQELEELLADMGVQPEGILYEHKPPPPQPPAVQPEAQPLPGQASGAATPGLEASLASQAKPPQLQSQRRGSLSEADIDDLIEGRNVPDLVKRLTGLDMVREGSEGGSRSSSSRGSSSLSSKTSSSSGRSTEGGAASVYEESFEEASPLGSVEDSEEALGKEDLAVPAPKPSTPRDTALGMASDYSDELYLTAKAPARLDSAEEEEIPSPVYSSPEEAPSRERSVEDADEVLSEEPLEGSLSPAASVPDDALDVDRIIAQASSFGLGRDGEEPAEEISDDSVSPPGGHPKTPKQPSMEPSNPRIAAEVRRRRAKMLDKLAQKKEQDSLGSLELSSDSSSDGGRPPRAPRSAAKTAAFRPSAQGHDSLTEPGSPQPPPPQASASPSPASPSPREQARRFSFTKHEPALDPHTAEEVERRQSMDGCDVSPGTARSSAGEEGPGKGKSPPSPMATRSLTDSSAGLGVGALSPIEEDGETPLARSLNSSTAGLLTQSITQRQLARAKEKLEAAVVEEEAGLVEAAEEADLRGSYSGGKRLSQLPTQETLDLGDAKPVPAPRRRDSDSSHASLAQGGTPPEREDTLILEREDTLDEEESGSQSTVREAQRQSSSELCSPKA